jgi:hypothetical protein
MIYKIGDTIHTKKPHACGGNVWEVAREGADCKIKCLKCGKVIMLTPDELTKMTKKLIRAENV